MERVKGASQHMLGYCHDPYARNIDGAISFSSSQSHAPNPSLWPVADVWPATVTCVPMPRQWFVSGVGRALTALGLLCVFIAAASSCCVS
jgi:hypothetical protein